MLASEQNADYIQRSQNFEKENQDNKKKILTEMLMFSLLNKLKSIMIKKMLKLD